MATRDNSQGFGFVYVDVKQLLLQKGAIEQNPEVHPQESTAFSIHFPKQMAIAAVYKEASEEEQAKKIGEEFAKVATNPKTVVTQTPIIPSPESTEKKKPMEERIGQIKQNLDRLQQLHSKLHSVLEELSNVSRKNKK